MKNIKLEFEKMEYIIPESKVYEIHSEGIICSSPNGEEEGVWGNSVDDFGSAQDWGN